MSSEIELLKQLRDITGAGMMDCKKYLQKASNNIDEAVKLMRSEEGIKADKKSSRIAAEGVVYHFNSDSKCILIEVNSETDFVARSDDFISYVNECCKIILSSNILSEEDILNNIDKGFNEKFENLRKNAITKMGENIIVRRFRVFNLNDYNISGYTHNNKIGAIVCLKNQNDELGKDICMQIVASNPIAKDEKSIDESIISSEREVFKAELEKLDKKEDVKRNILEGKIKKFISENTLINQPFIKDSSQTLKQILKDNEIISYVRYQLGEGLEKKNEDFAKEVYNQIK